MKFDPKITSTEKKTGYESDNKDNDEEMLKIILISKFDKTKNPHIETFIKVKILQITWRVNWGLRLKKVKNMNVI